MTKSASDFIALLKGTLIVMVNTERACFSFKASQPDVSRPGNQCLMVQERERERETMVLTKKTLDYKTLSGWINLKLGFNYRLVTGAASQLNVNCETGNIQMWTWFLKLMRYVQKYIDRVNTHTHSRTCVIHFFYFFILSRQNKLLSVCVSKRLH